MTMRKLACLAVVASVALAGSAARAEKDKPEDAAQAAAQAWLQLVDEGRYGDSWNQAGKLLKAALTRQQWEQAGAAARQPFGKLVSRALKSRQYTKTLPGAPDGEYVVIEYETAFEKKASAVETVTPALDPDGAWRVSGYYIR